MFTAEKSALLAALSLTGAIVERRNTIPILSHVCLSKPEGEGRLKARMTDLDTEAEIEFAAEVEGPVKPFTVPAHLLLDIVKKLPDGAEIRVEAADASVSGVRIKAGRSRFSLQTLDASDFPTMGAADMPCRFELPAKALASALDAVSFAISTEETRYYLNGVFLHAVEGGVMLVATDGHRLAKRFIALPDGMTGPPGIIIPRKTVNVLAKILPKDGMVEIAASDAKIMVVTPDTRLTSKLIDGTFPDYQRVIPQAGPMRVELDGRALSAAVDRVSTVSTERGRAARFAFRDGQLTLTVTNPDAGNAEEAIAYDGEAEIETGFNAKYVLEALGHLTEGTITMAIQDVGSPAILRADGDHTENLVVLMPMRV
jgi:DNA polymerase-3 subunit beta